MLGTEPPETRPPEEEPLLTTEDCVHGPREVPIIVHVVLVCEHENPADIYGFASIDVNPFTSAQVKRYLQVL